MFFLSTTKLLWLASCCGEAKAVQVFRFLEGCVPEMHVGSSSIIFGITQSCREEPPDSVLPTSIADYLTPLSRTLL